ncbi:MAG: phospholipase [Verrucomicrobia bacterium]|nr:phospholipase [Verrucomicrobiota bacterium]
MQTKFILALVCLSGLAHYTTRSQDDMPITNQKALKFERTLKREVALNYLLFLPNDYEIKGAKRWPLMLFLHGAGERGTNLSKVTLHGPPKLVKEKRDFPFILVSPQCPSNQRWDNDALLALLDEVVKEHSVDPKRIYLTGLSMGGYGTWSLGVSHPDRFAAIAPICGGGEIIDVLLASRSKAPALRSLGVWAFHGGKDGTVKVSESERMVNALKSAGGKEVELTIYPEAGHDSWTETYNNPKLYEWFLQHSR